MKKFLCKKRTLFLLGAILFFLTGITAFCVKDNVLLSQDARFEKFTQKLFTQQLQSNTLNLHYTLAYPENYGIDSYSISLGSMAPDNLKKNYSSVKRLQKKLEGFSSAELSVENQMIYDILRLQFATELSVSDKYLLQEPLAPSLGIQAQLPVLLAEYTFRTPSDIKDYFSLLSAIPSYFDEILEFEQKKAEQGLFMNDTAADNIVRQCSSFAENQEENYLYEMFQEQTDRLLASKSISASQAASYIEMHQKLLKETVFPSYQTLAAGLSKLKGTGKNENGLAHLPGGKAYYEYLIKSNVGDYRSVKEIEQQLYRQLLADYEEMQALQKQDSQLLTKAAQVPVTASYTPEQMLDYLNHRMTDDFPSLTVENYDVKYVPASMEEFSSPAFYLTPPVDTLTPNTIYINQSSQVSSAELFTTLAHEGFPGHLYQTVYFGSRQKAPIRELLSCSGYTEGWATYVEDISYGYGADFLNIEPNVMRFLSLNRSVSLCLYSLLDLGIHDKGWTLKVVTETLVAFGIPDENVCKEIFQYIVENPSNYLKYYLGYLNFTSLQNTVKSMEGDTFSMKEFHQNLLEIGPAPFPVVKKYLLLRY